MKLIIMYINFLFLLAASPEWDCFQGKAQDVVGNFQQDPVITGRIEERGSGLPIQGVIVRWKGTAQSALSKADGSYRIDIQPGARKLVFSKPGWIEKTVRVSKGKILDIRMKRIRRDTVPAQPAEDLPADTLFSANYAPVEGTSR